MKRFFLLHAILGASMTLLAQPRMSEIEHAQKQFPKPESRGVNYPNEATGGAVFQGYIDQNGTMYACLPRTNIRTGITTHGDCDGRNGRYVRMPDAVPKGKRIVRFQLVGGSSGQTTYHIYWK